MKTDTTTNVTGASPGSATEPSSAENAPIRRPRGFAAIDRDRVRAIASKGGKAAHEQGTAHKFNTEEARAAGKKGGAAAHKWRGKAPAVAATTATPDEVKP